MMTAAVASTAPGVNGTVRMVVQRCTSAKLLVDNKDKWAEVGRGLVLHLGFAEGVQKDSFRGICRSLLRSGFSTSAQWSADHSDTKCVVDLVKEGTPQDILIIPQASTVCKVEKGDKYIKYNRQAEKELSRELFVEFGRVLRQVGRELITGEEVTKVDPRKTNLFKERMANKAPLVAPELLFKSGEYEGKYSAYDDRGVPTKDAAGEEIAKSQKKKLEKFFATHCKKYEKEQSAPKSEESGEVADKGGYPEAGNPVPEIKELSVEQKYANLFKEIDDERIEMEKATPEFRVVMGTFGNRQGFEMVSTGPFTHILGF